MVYQFNALYIPSSKEGIFSGVRVIESSGYGQLAMDNPSLRFQNWGDFHSDVGPLNIGTRLEEILGELQEEGAFKSSKLLKGTGLNNIQSENDLKTGDADVYIVDQGRRGVTLHVPMFAKNSSSQHQGEVAYGLGSMLVLPQLFTDRIGFQGGSYRGDCEKVIVEFSKLNSTLRELGLSMIDDSDRDRYDLIHR
ncbi:MAG: hypothetical protein LAT82_03530 [Nanoarchaeota archaeon]|nr:hypothetical protein [Nanoarchaeota archaeon]